MSRTTLVFSAGVFVAMIAAGSMTLVLGGGSPGRHGAIGGPFVMEDMSGRRVTDADLNGKPTVLFFGFTHCPDACPTALAMLTDAMQHLGAAADRLNVVFVTVDPQRDTPEQLRLYLSSFDPRIRGLSGTEGQVAAMAKAYHVLYRRVPLKDGDYTMDHSAALLTFDGAGLFAGAMPYDQDEATVVATLRRLIDRDRRDGSPTSRTL